MSKETEKRLIKTLEFLKEPQGSTIPTIVKAIQDNDPEISLKRIVQTLKGCLDNGMVKVADGRVKLKQMGSLPNSKSYKSEKSDGMPEYLSRMKNPCQKSISKCPKTCQGTPAPDPDNPEPNPENPENPENPDGDDKCKPKPKPKPKCPRPKRKPCPKPKKKKPKCKPKPKPKKCAPKKKIQPYCKKKKKCPE